ncbi:tetratricopeptide repeat protein [Undibacterium sp. Tian12W]|uniref:tetratricopeptide repeat protein n=1 Tax=Undibacterium sp. Tian12W TaxID=3413054 RepID=UPI003BF218FF
MRNPPLFFIENQLNADADERAVKRAYARKLKQIDQEKDLQGFQDLRDSYEAALSWLRYRDQFQGQFQLHAMSQVLSQAEDDGIASVADNKETTPALQDTPVADEMSSQENADVAQDAQDAQVAGGQDENPAPDAAIAGQAEDAILAAQMQQETVVVGKTEIVSPEAAAKKIFNEMLEAMRLHCESGNDGANSEASETSDDSEDDFAGQNLTALLDDMRLFHMETRLIFEGLLADYLLQGWQPGNGELFDVAVENFGWQKDRQRLLQLGRPGRVIDRALTDAAEFYRKDKRTRAKLWALVTKIRKEKFPHLNYLKANLSLLRHMQASYLSWLLLVTSRENLAQWSAVAEEIDSQEPIGDQRVYVPKEDNTGHPAYWIFIAVFVFFGMFSGRDRPTPKYDPGQFTSAGRMPFDLDKPDSRLTLEQRIEKAEVLLALSKEDKSNLKTAVRSLETLAGEDSSKAAYRLGWLYRDGKFAPADKQRQYAWFLRAAELGNTQASIIVGDLLMDGMGDKPNHQEAFSHYKKAADQGDALGQFKLAYMIDHGYGIKPDRAVAARLIKSSAEKGFAYSESLMGQFHLRGEYGFPRDEVKSANWFSLSATHGDASGERYFGLVHEQGLGAYKINLAEAAKWYGKARDHGDKEAEKSLQRLCKKQEFSECKPASVSVSTVSVVTKAQ